ncbi:hypothetical protein KAN5_16820 [Pseudoalteromonas sp. KAN5]|nr:hypothetical protein KAN5_16820 [Pseudoalteromonas sp. KAN5]
MSFKLYNSLNTEKQGGRLDTFNITRIDTKFGIFRICGLWDRLNIDVFNITSIDIMSTDGWLGLDKTNDTVINLMAELVPILQLHLLNKINHIVP